MKHPDDLHVNCLNSDKWDQKDCEDVIDDIIALGQKRWAFSESIPTGDPLFADTLIGLMRAMPKLRDAHEIRPSHTINRWLLNIVMHLSQWEALRNESTVGDPYASATGLMPLADIMIAIYENLGSLPQQFIQLDTEICETMHPGASDPSEPEDQEQAETSKKGGNPEDPSDEDASGSDGPTPLDSDEQQIPDDLQERFETLCEQLEAETPGAKVKLGKGMEQINEQLTEEREAASSWGLEPGELVKLPSAERLALANRMRTNPQLKKMADLIGVMKPLAFAALRRSIHHGTVEVSSVDRSGDLARIMPSELAKIKVGGPLGDLALMEFVEGNMLSYKVAEKAREARGGMVVIRDSSGSMSGPRDVFAGALGAVLLLTAKEQNRPFRGVIFGSRGQQKIFEFDSPSDITPAAVIDFASYSFHGGTEFEESLTTALNWLIDDHQKRVTCRSDIVFITDGRCGVTSTFQERFLSEMTRIDGRLYGLLMGVSPHSEPLYTLANGHTRAVRDLNSGRDLTQLFEDIA